MNNVSFYGNEPVYTTSAQKRYAEAPGQTVEQAPVIKDEGGGDTVCFKGREGKKKNSVLTPILLTLGTVAAGIAALGYAHKAGWISKINYKPIKNGLNKIAEPCHNWCSKSKQFCVDSYNKVKDKLAKKKD